MTETKFVHVDQFIDDPMSLQGKGMADLSERYAKFWLDWARRSASFHATSRPFFVHKLFCTFEGERHRVTGASRMGDIWLTKNFEQTMGYQKRVNLADCSLWWMTEEEPTPSKIETAQRFEDSERALNISAFQASDVVEDLDRDTLLAQLRAANLCNGALASALFSTTAALDAATLTLLRTVKTPGVQDALNEDVKSTLSSTLTNMKAVADQAQVVLVEYEACAKKQ